MKFFKNVLVALVNPVSPIVTLIVGFLLSIILEIPKENTPKIISVLIDNPVIIIAFLVLWLLMSVLYTIMSGQIEQNVKELAQKEEIIREKDNQLKHTSAIVLNRSGDFANFNRLLRFNEALEGFVENNTVVECVQMYSYSTKRIGKTISIRVNYDSGFCSDGIDINNLAQCYYDIDYKDYNTLKDIIDVWKRLSSDTHILVSEKDSMLRILVNGINDIYRRYYEELKSLSNVNNVESIHFTQYRIMTLLSRLARRQSTTMFDKSRILGEDKKEIENYLLNGKRTGILNSILLEDIFMFKYTRNSHKKDGRAYVAFPLNISMQKYICIFSIQTLDLDSRIDLEYEIKSLREDIIKRFEKK